MVTARGHLAVTWQLWSTVGAQSSQPKPDSLKVLAAQAIIILNSRYPEAINNFLSLLLDQLRAFGAQHKFLFWPSPISSLLFSLLSLQLVFCIFVDTKIHRTSDLQASLQASGEHMKPSSHNAHRNTDALQQIREQPRGSASISVSNHLLSTHSRSSSNFLLFLSKHTSLSVIYVKRTIIQGKDIELVSIN